MNGCGLSRQFFCGPPPFGSSVEMMLMTTTEENENEQGMGRRAVESMGGRSDGGGLKICEHSNIGHGASGEICGRGTGEGGGQGEVVEQGGNPLQRCWGVEEGRLGLSRTICKYAILQHLSCSKGRDNVVLHCWPTNTLLPPFRSHPSSAEESEPLGLEAVHLLGERSVPKKTKVSRPTRFTVHGVCETSHERLDVTMADAQPKKRSFRKFQ